MIPNGGTGISVSWATLTQIGGLAEGERNTISGNGENGIWLQNVDDPGSLIAGNYVGTNTTGMAALPNTAYGIQVSASTKIDIIQNLVSGNDGWGVVLDVSSTDNLVIGNLVGVTSDGLDPLPNREGIVISGASANRVGGVTPPERNVISGNRGDGIALGNSANSNLILGNYIGTDVTGTTPIPNGLNPVVGPCAGVYIVSGSGNAIGGAVPGEGNLIAHNEGCGVVIEQGDGNRVLSNRISRTRSSGSISGNTIHYWRVSRRMISATRMRDQMASRTSRF